MIHIDLRKQVLHFTNAQKQLFSWQISSGKNGIGEIDGSGCTPRGRHRIYSKIGNGAPLNSVFVGRKWTGEIYTEQLGKQFPERDWILTRIMQLYGMEPGFNQGGNRDSLQRYIYIHGTHDQTAFGEPGSKGCIRMRNEDLLFLFDMTELNTTVEITD